MISTVFHEAVWNVFIWNKLNIVKGDKNKVESSPWEEDFAKTERVWKFGVENNLGSPYIPWVSPP